MQKKGWILFLILLCVAFLVSCKGKEDTETERGELVRVEAQEEGLGLPFQCALRRTSLMDESS